MILSVILMAGTVYASDQKPTYTVVANANTRGESMAAAMSRLPYGAEIKKIGFNGSSIRTCTEERGNYNCKIIYTK